MMNQSGGAVTYERVQAIIHRSLQEFARDAGTGATDESIVLESHKLASVAVDLLAALST